MNGFIKRFKSLTLVYVGLLLTILLLWADLEKLDQAIRDLEKVYLPFALLTADLSVNATLNPDEDSWHEEAIDIPKTGTIFEALMSIEPYLTYRFSGSVALPNGERLYLRRLVEDVEREPLIEPFNRNLEADWGLIGKPIHYEVFAVKFPDQASPEFNIVLADTYLRYAGYGNLSAEKGPTVLIDNALYLPRELASKGKLIAGKWVQSNVPLDTVYLSLRKIRENKTFTVPAIGVSLSATYVSLAISLFCVIVSLVMLHTTEAMFILRKERAEEPWIFILPSTPAGQNESLSHRALGLFGSATVLAIPFLPVIVCFVNLFALSSPVAEKAVAGLCLLITIILAFLSAISLSRLKYAIKELNKT